VLGFFYSEAMSEKKPKLPRKKAAAPAEAKPPGRPSTFSQTIADAICDRLADGESLRTVCRDERMPGKSTVFRWLAANQVFQDQYARACEVRADEIFDQMLEIADTPQIGEKRTTKEWGTEVSKADMIDHRKLQVETRKWALGKMMPKKYGDKLAIGGADDLPPIKTMSDADLDAEIARLAAAHHDSDQ
jgi:transposase